MDMAKSIGQWSQADGAQRQEQPEPFFVAVEAVSGGQKQERVTDQKLLDAGADKQDLFHDIPEEFFNAKDRQDKIIWPGYGQSQHCQEKPRPAESGYRDAQGQESFYFFFEVGAVFIFIEEVGDDYKDWQYQDNFNAPKQLGSQQEARVRQKANNQDDAQKCFGHTI